VRGSDSGLSHGRGVVLIPLGDGGGCRGGLLPINGREVGLLARHSRQDGGGGWQRGLGLG
jgi:hypothetical protein